jgi:hypothetical protein
MRILVLKIAYLVEGELELSCLVRGGEPVVVVHSEHQRLVKRVPGEKNKAI